MIVVDTNIIAALYINGAYSGDALALRKQDEFWRTEPFALIELSNILATFERARYISKTSAEDCLFQAEAFLGPRFQAIPHHKALDFAFQYRVTAYDARFLAIAAELGTKLTTQDAKLRSAAPALTQSLTDALALS